MTSPLPYIYVSYQYNVSLNMTPNLHLKNGRRGAFVVFQLKRSGKEIVL